MRGEEREQRAHLRRRALPVVGGKGVQRELPDAAPRAVFDDIAHGACTGDVSRASRLCATFGPASVAIHDDGDVVGGEQSTLYHKVELRKDDATWRRVKDDCSA